MSGVLFYNRPFQKHHRTQRLKARHLFLQSKQPFRNDDIIFLKYACIRVMVGRPTKASFSIFLSNTCLPDKENKPGISQ